MYFKWKSLLTIFLSAFTTITSASIVQFFWANTYNNPASLFFTKKLSFTGGAIGIDVMPTFKGIGGGGRPGVARSAEEEVLPYFILSSRVNDKLVLGVNISQPFFGDFNYPLDSIVAYDNTRMFARVIDIAPQASYQLTQNLVLGAGLNFNDVDKLEINSLSPQGFGNTVTRGSDWSYGWNAGFFYTLNQSNFLGFAYFSKLNPEPAGYSFNHIAYNPNYKLIGLVFPPTMVATLIHGVTKDFTAILRVLYSQWSKTKQVYFLHVAPDATLYFPVYYRDTPAVELVLKYQLNDKYSFLAGGLFDRAGGTPQTSSIAFPATDLKVIFFGGVLQATPSASFQLVFGSGYLNAGMSHPFNFPTVGHLKLRSYLVDFRFVYNV